MEEETEAVGRDDRTAETERVQKRHHHPQQRQVKNYQAMESAGQQVQLQCTLNLSHLYLLVNTD